MEVRETLHQVLIETKELKVPLLIVANKQDLKGALTPEDLEKELGFEMMANEVQKRIHIHGTSAKTGIGLREAFSWIIE